MTWSGGQGVDRGAAHLPTTGFTPNGDRPAGPGSLDTILDLMSYFDHGDVAADVLGHAKGVQTTT